MTVPARASWNAATRGRVALRTMGLAMLREQARGLTRDQRNAFMAAWLGFGCTFGTVRLITHGIRGGWLPWGNISTGGTHLHHYNFGIATLAGVGLVAVRGDRAYVGHPALGAAYGAGSALIARFPRTRCAISSMK